MLFDLFVLVFGVLVGTFLGAVSPRIGKYVRDALGVTHASSRGVGGDGSDAKPEAPKSAAELMRLRREKKLAEQKEKAKDAEKTKEKEKEKDSEKSVEKSDEDEEARLEDLTEQVKYLVAWSESMHQMLIRVAETVSTNEYYLKDIIPSSTKPSTRNADPASRKEQAKSAQPAILKEGWLQIRQLKMWHRRFVQVHRGWISVYMSQEATDASCLGHVVLSGCRLTQRSEDEFELMHPDKKKIFRSAGGSSYILLSSSVFRDGYSVRFRALDGGSAQEWVLPIHEAMDVSVRKETKATPARPHTISDESDLGLSSSAPLASTLSERSATFASSNNESDLMAEEDIAFESVASEDQVNPGGVAVVSTPVVGLGVLDSEDDISGPQDQEELQSEEEEGDPMFFKSNDPPIEMTPQEEESSCELRKLLVAGGEDSTRISDRTLLRFLKARQYDPERACMMLLETMEWRDSFRPFEIRIEELEAEVMRRHSYFIGKDLKGRPLLCIFSARHNPAERDLNTMVRYVLFLLESAARRMDPGVWQISLIFDYEGFSSRTNSDLTLIKELVGYTQNHYPERMGQTYLVNYSWTLSALYKVVKPLLDERTSKKVMFCSGIDDLKEHASADVLLTCHGGSNTYVPTGLSIGLENL